MGQMIPGLLGNAAMGALGGIFGGGGGPGGGGEGPQQAQAMSREQMRQTDMQQAETIRAQIAADAQKQQAERWKIMADTQTKIFEITQDVTINKCKTADKCANAFDAYIRA